MAEWTGYNLRKRVHGRVVKSGEFTDSGNKEISRKCVRPQKRAKKRTKKLQKRVKPLASHELHFNEELKQKSGRGIALKEFPAKKESPALEEPPALEESAVEEPSVMVRKGDRKAYNRSVKSLKPEEGADMGVEVRLGEPPQQSWHITQLAPDTVQYNVREEGTLTAEVNQTAEVSLLASCERTEHEAVIVSELESVYNGSVVKCEVEPSGPGEYRIQYTPTVRGRHSLTVSVDGQQVAGSPFPVFVSIHPTQLGKPVKVYSGLEYPHGVAFTSEGDLLVIGTTGDIVKIDKEGNKRVLVEHTKTRLSFLSAIAVDREDNVYCTDLKSNNILQCDKNGGGVLLHHIYKLRPGFRGLAIVGDEVMMCESTNSGTILVYNREFQFLRRIEQEGVGEFDSIASDQQDNLYVTDSIRSNILVFRKDGLFLRFFHRGQDLDIKTLFPHGVCVSGPYVYITNWGTCNVAIFTLAGEWVSSFGSGGRKEGFDPPCGVCVDADGFVYIADRGNHRVQCF